MKIKVFYRPPPLSADAPGYRPLIVLTSSLQKQLKFLYRQTGFSRRIQNKRKSLRQTSSLIINLKLNYIIKHTINNNKIHNY